MACVARVGHVALPPEAAAADEDAPSVKSARLGNFVLQTNLFISAQTHRRMIKVRGLTDPVE